MAKTTHFAEATGIRSKVDIIVKSKSKRFYMVRLVGPYNEENITRTMSSP